MNVRAVFLLIIGFAVGVSTPALIVQLNAIQWPSTEAAATLWTGFAGALVGLIATGAAIWGVASQRAISRRQVTFEQLARSESDGSFQKALRIFNAEALKEGGLEGWASKESEGKEEQKAIVTVLNDFELYSIGIQRGIIDGPLYKQLNRGTVIFAWKNAERFIVALRRRVGNDNLYHEFEEMARWMRAGALPKRRFWWAS